jgi:hypothetical protein
MDSEVSAAALAHSDRQQTHWQQQQRRHRVHPYALQLVVINSVVSNTGLLTERFIAVIEGFGIHVLSPQAEQSPRNPDILQKMK